MISKEQFICLVSKSPISKPQLATEHHTAACSVPSIYCSKQIWQLNIELTLFELRSAVLAVSPPNFLCTPYLLTGGVVWGAEKVLCDHCLLIPKRSLTTGVRSMGSSWCCSWSKHVWSAWADQDLYLVCAMCDGNDWSKRHGLETEHSWYREPLNSTCKF